MTVNKKATIKPVKPRNRLTADKVSQAIEEYIKTLTDTNGNFTKEPLLIEVALILGISDDTLYRYSKQQAYAPAIKRVKRLGELYLNRTMEGDKANQNAMFKLKTRHGYIEQQKLDITSANQPLGIIQLPKR